MLFENNLGLKLTVYDFHSVADLDSVENTMLTTFFFLDTESEALLKFKKEVSW